MNIQFNIPEDLEAGLLNRVKRQGISPEAVVIEVLRNAFPDSAEVKPAVADRSKIFFRTLQEIIELHPKGRHFVDDSRESIYAGCRLVDEKMDCSIPAPA